MDGLVAAALVVVPLVSSTAFVDQYTTVKWYAVHAFAAAWLLAEVWICRSAGWPAFVRERRVLVALLAAAAAWSALATGPGRALAPLVDRAACAVLVLCASWFFTRSGDRTLPLVAGLSVSAAVTIALGLAQAGGLVLPAALAAREGPAALFGNVNMAAQFVALALLVVLGTPAAGGGARRVAWDAFRVALALGGGLYLYLLASRSVLLALAVSAAFLASRGQRRRPAAAAAFAVAALLALAWWHPGARRDPHAAERKASSVKLRLALWSDTLDLVRDRPLGVGAGNFEHAFLPYQARGRLEPQEGLVYRSPHNEYLRFLAEDGAVFCALAGALLALLAVRRRRAPPGPPGRRALVAAWATFIAVEAAFQFPLALATGALAASITVGAALADSDPVPPPRTRGAWLAGATAAGVLLLAGSLRIARSEYLYVSGPDDPASQRRACALDPRNLPACVTAAWLEVREGDAAAARTRLDGILAATPHYPPALKLRGEIAAMEGNDAEACRWLSEYDRLFRGASAVHALAERACAAP